MPIHIPLFRASPSTRFGLSNLLTAAFAKAVNFLLAVSGLGDRRPNSSSNSTLRNLRLIMPITLHVLQLLTRMPLRRKSKPLCSLRQLSHQSTSIGAWSYRRGSAAADNRRLVTALNLEDSATLDEASKEAGFVASTRLTIMAIKHVSRLFLFFVDKPATHPIPGLITRLGYIR